VFQIDARGRPESVWDVLTSPVTTRQFLGASLASTWEPGAAVEGWRDGDHVLRGEVLFSQCPNRLTYALGVEDGQPEVYVTWSISSSAYGTVVGLDLDEGVVDVDDGLDGLEQAWLPVVSALEGLLATLPPWPAAR